MANALLIGAVVLGCLVATAMAALRLPGTWLMVLGAVVLGWSDGWTRVTVPAVLVLSGIAVLAEVTELLASVLTAKRAGASSQASWGGMIGGILGAVFLSFLIPVPVAGTIIGAILGCFAGAAAMELRVRKRLDHGARVGVFAAVGCVLGMAVKISMAIVMSAILVSAAWGR